MTTYRTGNHWGTTIIETGTQPPAADGTRADDRLVAVVLHDDAALAERICTLLNSDGLARAAAKEAGLDVATLEADPAARAALMELVFARHSSGGGVHGRPLSATESAQKPPAVAEPTPGCPEDVWDGPYRMQCGLGGSAGKCPTHGAFKRGDA